MLVECLNYTITKINKKISDTGNSYEYLQFDSTCSKVSTFI